MRNFLECASARNLRFGKVGALGVGATLDDEPFDTRPHLEAMIPTTITKTIHREKEEENCTKNFSSEERIERREVEENCEEKVI